MTIEEIFKKAEGGSLTWEQFQELSKEAKFVDLTDGNYYSKAKHEDELAAKDKQINSLNATIKTRDTDLTELQAKLAEAGEDSSKLQELTSNLSALQTKYDGDMKSYKEQLKKQSYEFAVKEFANNQKFTSQSAKKAFVQSMIAKDLKMEKDTILGADDFLKVYQESDPDAFVVEQPPVPPAPEQPLPSFGQPTPPTPTPGDDNAFINAFHFGGVREHK